MDSFLCARSPTFFPGVHSGMCSMGVLPGDACACITWGLGVDVRYEPSQLVVGSLLGRVF